MTEYPAFIGGHSLSQSPIANCGTLQNSYVQALNGMIGSKSGKCLYPTPGVERFGSVAQVGGKRFFSTAASNSRVFSITGMRLYEWFEDGSAIERGTVAVDANPATICTNGDGGQQLGITAGDNFYCYDLLTNTLTEVLTGTATQAGFIKGYFLVFDLATGTVYQSDLYDGLVFDPLNFFQRNTQADDWNAMLISSLGRVFLPGTKTRDNYEDVGTFPIPFAPSDAGLQPEGCVATFSVAEAGNAVCWLGTAGQSGGYKVYAAAGYRATVISDESISFALSQFTQAEIAAATGESYTDQDQDFYLLTVGDTTFGYAFQTNLWHTRRTFTSAVSGVLGAWRARWHCFGFNKHLWLDNDTGVAYQSDISFPLDVDGLEIQRQRTAPSIRVLNDVIDIGDIELIMQVGVGNANAPGRNPTITLAISGDGGITWGPERSAEVGPIGKTMVRVRWQSNGIPDARDVALRFTMTDAINNYRIMMLLVDLRRENGQAIDLARQAA